MVYDFSVIILSLILLIYFSYRGYNLTFTSPLIVVVVVLLMADKPLMFSLNVTYMKAVAKFISDFMLLFLVGSTFGKIISDSGVAKSLANFMLVKIGDKYAIIVVVLVTSLLTYNGISLLIVSFIIYPFAKHLFYSLNMPKKIIPACISLGGFAYTVNLPGGLQLINVIPTQYLGTSIYSSPILGFLSSFSMLLLGLIWILLRQHRYKKRNVGYGYVEHFTEKEQNDDVPSPYVAIFIFIAIIVSNLLLSNFYFLGKNPGDYGVTDMSLVKSKYSVLSSLFFASLVLLFVVRKHLLSIKGTLVEGVAQSINPMVSVASVVGYGTVIISLSSFIIVEHFIINNTTPIIGISLITAMFVSFFGSGLGGLSVALDTIITSPFLYKVAKTIDPPLLHRLLTLASVSLAALPHHGGVVSLITMSKMKYKEVYLDIFIVSCLIPFIVFITVLFIV